MKTQDQKEREIAISHFNLGYNKAIKDIKTARQCLDFQDIKCHNKSCLNCSCPLNNKYKSKEQWNK